MAPAVAQMNESYEEIRQRNIAANRSLLLSLQLAVPGGFGPSLIPKNAGPKKTAPMVDDQKESRGGGKKRRKTTQQIKVDEEEKEQETGGRRRSGRILQLQQRDERKRAGLDDESEESDDEDEYEARDEEHSDESESKENGPNNSRKRKSNWRPPTEPKRPRGSLPPQRKAKCLKGNRPNPKIFGQQIGTEVGDWWDSRMACSQAGVHAPPVCGIAGSDGVGCWSVALSGGYEDDVDLGYAFTFTGSGGRALSGTAEKPKNLRTAPQSSDQEFTMMNASLRLSCELKNPVRVIRGYKNHSPFSPEQGYRYDGLYRVEKCWREAGQSGFQVCKFAFVRLPNQPRIPIKAGREAEAEQILRDMGIESEGLSGMVAESQQWTPGLAKQRIRQQQERGQGTAEEPELADSKAEDGQQMEVDEQPKLEIPEVDDPKLSSPPENTHDGSSLEPERSAEKQVDPDQPIQEPLPSAIQTIQPSESPKADEPEMMIKGSATVSEARVMSTAEEPEPADPEAEGGEQMEAKVDISPETVDQKVSSPPKNIHDGFSLEAERSTEKAEPAIQGPLPSPIQPSGSPKADEPEVISEAMG